MKIFKSGFTLTEMLITIGIISIVAAIIIPGIQKRSNALVYQAKADKVAAQIQNGVMAIFQEAMINGNNESGFHHRLTELRRRDFGTGNNNNFFYLNELNGNLSNITLDAHLRSDDFIVRRRERGRDTINFFSVFSSVLGIELMQDDLPVNYETALTNQLNGIFVRFARNLYLNYMPFNVLKSDAIVIVEVMNNNATQLGDIDPLVRIVIDVNGERGPNQLHIQRDNQGNIVRDNQGNMVINPRGDIFIYALANNGDIYPEGTEAFEIRPNGYQ